MNDHERRIHALRDKAARCRRLSEVSSNPQTAATLRSYAIELETEAAFLEAGSPAPVSTEIPRPKSPS
jgi:hypothetical protein